MGEVKKTERFLELEGLRGIAAVAVAMYHTLLGFFTFGFLGFMAGDPAVQHSRFETFLLGNPLAVFVSGTFAVSIFFVLSGFVLSIGFFQTGREDIVKSLAVRRYLRLMLPALASTLVCLAAITIGLSRVHETQAITHSAWLAAMWNPPYDLFDALRSGTFGIFLQGQSSYNNVLWTMTTEFLGSFMVFVTLFVAGKSRYRWIVYILLGVLTVGTWYMGFVAGMILADIYTHRPKEQYTHHILVTSLLGLLAIYLGGFPAPGPIGFFYQWVPSIFQTTFYVAGAIAAVSIALWSKSVRKLLAWRPLSTLGKYTFSLYLIHIPIVYTFTYWVFLKLHFSYGYTVSALLAILVSIPVIAAATYLFEKFIDAPAIRLATKFSNVFLGKEKLKFTRYQNAYRRGVSFVRSTLIGTERPRYVQLPNVTEVENKSI